MTAPMLRRLGCLRWIGTPTGVALAVEVGDWDRFTDGKTRGVRPTRSQDPGST